MPKDDLRLPRLPPAALSPEVLAALKSQHTAEASSRRSGSSSDTWPPPPRSNSRGTELTEQRRAITALERDLAATATGDRGYRA